MIALCSFPPGVYRVHNLRITSGNNLLVSGHGATLKKIDDSTSVFWDDGAALLTLCACTHVQIDGLSFDGNRLNQTGNTGMNFGILVLPAVPDGTDTLDDNFADDKPTKHIQIRNCSFYRTGAYAVGDDKFGDGIYVFAADDVIIENCYFENMGRWGVVMSDVFNALIRANVFDNAIAGDYATALGAIDIEQESGDATNGSYSSNIVIERNKLRGRAIFAVNVIPNAANHDGTYHYIKGLRFEYNETGDCLLCHLGFGRYQRKSL